MRVYRSSGIEDLFYYLLQRVLYCDPQTDIENSLVQN